MKNLLEETLEVLNQHGLSPKDIIYIGTDPNTDGPYHSCTWREYKVMADRVYDNGWGTQEVAYDLVIIFKDGTHMERGEYDGSEWWEVRLPFTIPTKTKKAKALFGGFGSLEYISNHTDAL